MNINTVGIVSHKQDDHVLETVTELTKVFERRGVRVVKEPSVPVTDHYPSSDRPADRQILSECQLIVAVGGDGTLLGAARRYSEYGLPILGVNRGKLGFLTDIVPDRLGPSIDRIMEGKYTEEKREMLSFSLCRDGVEINSGKAVNDIVLHPGQSVRMIEFELGIDGDFVYRQRSDGLIVATPTGSTAYSLSAGGPIVHPSLKAIVLVPMFPQGLNQRPVVVPSHSELSITIIEENRTFPRVTCDGQTHVAIEPGDVLHIRRSTNPLTLWHPEDHSFYNIARSKLGWGRSDD